MNVGLIIAALAFDGLAGVSGFVLPDRWLDRHAAALVSFAIGALLGAAFLDALPEAVGALGDRALTCALFGLVAPMATEAVWGRARNLPITLLGSDALHNVGDGAVIAAAFCQSTRAGLAMSLAVLAHEVPEEIGDYALLRRARWTKRASLAALSAVQLTACLGAFAVWLARPFAASLAAYVIAFASGSFLYLAADLMPELRRAPLRGRVAAMAAGIGSIALINRLCR